MKHSSKSKNVKSTKTVMKPTSCVSNTGNDTYLCNMEINIFSAESTNNKTAITRHIYTLLIAILINNIFWFISGMSDSDYETSNSLSYMLIDFVSACIETIVVMEASFAVSRLVIRAFWKVKYSFASLLLQNIILLIGVILISAAISLPYALMCPEVRWLSWDVFLCDVLVAYFLTSVFFTSFLTNRYRKEKALAQQVTIDKLKLKTDNHFVFNSLATLGNLIQTDPEAAIEFNNSMSRMYRYIVSKGDSSVVSLQEEISFIEEYKKNLNIRHGNIDLVIEESLNNLNTFIPPLTLQGLVENAIKHNRHSSKDRLRIVVGYDKIKDCIVVSNNILPLSRAMESSKSGLDTLNQRYIAICGKQIVINNDGDSFTVSLPLIKQSDLL